MANPVVPWEIQSLVPDEDAPRITQNFSALTDWGTFEAVQQRHIQVATFDIPAIATDASATVTGITWPTPFPAGIIPVVLVQQNTTGGATAGVVVLVFYPNGITNAGCSIRIWNSGTANSAAPGQGKAVAIDPNFDITS